jgi:hypothetical protein
MNEMKRNESSPIRKRGGITLWANDANCKGTKPQLFIPHRSLLLLIICVIMQCTTISTGTNT